LNKDRPYLIIEEDEKTLLVLTLTKHSEEKDKEGKKDKEDKPSFRRVGPIKCPCLDFGTFIRLETKIIIAKKFIKDSYINLEKKAEIEEHKCLTEEQFLNLRNP
jgi:hypothetical protein